VSERAVPFHCPYCGGEDLWPHEVTDGPAHGAWECRSCLRAFRLSLLGQLRRPGATSAEAPR
jgi:transposase-like protein